MDGIGYREGDRVVAYYMGTDKPEKATVECDHHETQPTVLVHFDGVDGFYAVRKNLVVHDRPVNDYEALVLEALVLTKPLLSWGPRMLIVSRALAHKGEPVSKVARALDRLRLLGLLDASGYPQRADKREGRFLVSVGPSGSTRQGERWEAIVTDTTTEPLGLSFLSLATEEVAMARQVIGGAMPAGVFYDWMSDRR